jgi:hypothetical protein
LIDSLLTSLILPRLPPMATTLSSSSGPKVEPFHTEAEKLAIQQQLERVLASQHFSESKRYPSFLRFVTTRALQAPAEPLKERTLGAELFGRDPDYDTAADPIVRVTAAEIRKRIEHYYQEPGHEAELRFSLPSGSYLPQFATVPPEQVQIPASEVAATKSEAPRRTTFLWRAIGLSAMVVILAITGFLFLRKPEDRAFKEFWQPFLTASDPILFCVADQSQFSTITLRDAANPSRQTTISDTMVTVIMDDVLPLVNIAGVLQSNGKAYKLKSESSTTLTDLRLGPTVLIGAYDNSWTLRETSNLRFHFANNPEMTRFWIADRNNPSKLDWTIDRAEQQKGVYKDYALVARFVDPNTDRVVMVAAGIARGGTVAAGEFLVDPNQIKTLEIIAPKNWSKRNMELVLETQVIDGRSGPPRLVASHFW